uniref:3'(2'),5'-bisphosphate nucleotidase n=1 Tax=Alexandrium catenella TaxID=2925 RepID=A0A7S1W1L1_ALECA
MRRTPPVLNASTCVPEDVRNGEYGQEAQVGFSIMSEAIHCVNMATLCMEDKKDKSAIGLFGAELEREFVRVAKGGRKMCLAHTAMMTTTCKRLLEEFPDDPILCEEDTELLAKDERFAGTTAAFLTDFKIVEDATPEDAVRWCQHAGTYAAKADAGEAPSRYWAFTPLCSSDDFMQSKQFCMTLALIVDKQPVVSFIGCPVLGFNHPSRTVPHPSGVPFFFAVKGHGAWTQLVVAERDSGVYLGKAKLKGWPLPLKVEEKIKKENDGLYDVLGTNQLKIATGARLREDVFCDAERIGKILGSEYPKFDMTNSSIKYCWLARGETDAVMYLTRGLYNQSHMEHLAHHAAGALIAEESGAVVADLDGKPIDWCGPVLENNRGFAAVDPAKVPIMGLVNAVGQATSTSEELYDKRCEKRKEVAKILKYLFTHLGDYAENDEEREGARKVQLRGMKMLKDEEAMNEIAVDSMHRDAPFLGEAQVEDDAFGRSTDGSIPLSPISTG